MKAGGINRIWHSVGFLSPAKCRLYLVVGVLTFGSPTAEAAIFAKLDGVEGESQAVGHEGWMDVEGLGSMVSSERQVVDGEVLMTPNAEAFIFRKRIDKASPYLLEGLLKGIVFPELRIEQTSGNQVVGCYRMRGVRVSHQNLTTGTEGDVMLEELGFDFDVIEWHYFQNLEDAGPLRHIGSTWDFAIGEGGTVEQHGGEAPTIAPIAPVEIEPGKTVIIPVQLIDPSGNLEGLILKVLPSEAGLVKVLSIEGKTGLRTITLQAGTLLNGSDRLTLSVSDGERSSTRLLPILVAGSRTPYEAYMEGYLGELIKLDPDITRLLHDLDKDRLSNVMEFFLGTDPGVFTNRDEALTFEHKKSEAGTELRMRYFRRVEASGLSEGFEGSRGLSKWQPLGSQTEPRLEVEVLPGGTGEYEPVEATVYLEAPDDQDYFLRLSVEGQSLEGF